MYFPYHQGHFWGINQIQLQLFLVSNFCISESFKLNLYKVGFSIALAHFPFEKQYEVVQLR
jgi:hypothetical protein